MIVTAEKRIPQRFRYRDNEDKPWKYGCFVPVTLANGDERWTDNGTPIVLFLVRLEIYQAADFEWLDNDCGWPGQKNATPIWDEFAAVMAEVPEAEIQKLPVDGDWLPFSSAPRDGTTIIVYRGDAGVFTASYRAPIIDDDGTLSDDEDDWAWFDSDGEDLTGDEPTLWMAMPAPPFGCKPATETHYGHGEIEAACGGEFAQQVRAAVMRRREAIQSERSKTNQEVKHG
jgi:hypothetical protein